MSHIGAEHDKVISRHRRNGRSSFNEQSAGQWGRFLAHFIDQRAARDLAEGVLNYQLWGRLGWQEVRRRYTRTVLGPFWASLSMAIFVTALGLVYTNLWNQDPAYYLPFLVSGFLVWIPIATIITESSNVFVQAGSLCSQMRLPYTFFACALVWRNLIGMMHHFVVYLGVVLIYPLELTASIFLIPIGLLFIVLNGVWVALMLGALCLRYRDVKPLVTNVLQIVLFVTPIFWPPSLIGERGIAFVYANPFYHFVTAVRGPLIGETPEPLTYYYLTILTLLGWVMTLVIFPRIRAKIVYWQ